MIRLNKGLFFGIIEMMLLITGTGIERNLNNTLKKFYLRENRSKFRSVFSAVFIVSLSLVFLLSQVPIEAQAVGGSYTLKWYTADPSLNTGPYAPTYAKLTPAFLPSPGIVGRYADPLTNAVAYGTSSTLDAVASLAPKDMALGQVVPYEMVITADGSTAPENGTISFTTTFDTNTTSGDNFGFDPAYMVYCAFVDTADAGTNDPLNNAKVDNYTSTLIGSGSSQQIQGTFNVSGLDDGDQVVVEIWVVLKSTIPSGAGSKVQTQLQSAQTANGDSIGNKAQKVPLLQVKDFFTNQADVSVVIADSPDPVYQGQNITYDIVVKNNSPDTVANGVVVTDTIYPNAYFLSATGAPHTSYGNDVTFQVGALSPGQPLVIKMTTKVSETAATDRILSIYPDIGTPGPKPEVFDIFNNVVLTAVTTDPNATNNAYYQMTNVLPAVILNPSYNIDKTVADVAGRGPSGNVTTVGDAITYQIKVSNTGDVNLTNVTVTDSLINLTGPTDSLDPDRVLQIGEKWEYTGNYIATQTDISTNGGGNQLIENTATVDCDQLDPRSDIAEVPLRGVKAFVIDKSVIDVAGRGPSENISAEGEVIRYRTKVTNVGNANLIHVSVTDSLILLEEPEESLNADGILEIGEIWNYTGNYTVTKEDISTNGNGDQIIENKVTVVCDELEPKTAITEVPLKGLPAYTIDKSVIDVAGKGRLWTATKAGNTIIYEIIVRNVGNIGLTNISVSDSLLGTLVNHTESMSNNEIMEDEEIWTYRATYNVTRNDILTNGGGDKLINNIATVGCDQLTTKSDSAEVPVGSPSYIIDKLVTDVTGRGPLGNVTKVGDVISYLITIRNTGNVRLTNVSVNDSLTNLTGPVESKSPNGILDKQENWNYTGKYTVTQADINSNGGGNKLIENNVAVVCDELDPKSDSVEVPLEVPSYIIDKMVLDIAGKGSTGSIAAAGDKIAYKICVTNVGSVDLTNVSVTDSLISLTGPVESKSVNGILNVGENWTYSGNYTVTQEDLNTNGGEDQLIENTGTVDCDQLEPKFDIIEVPVEGTPAYTIDKMVTDVAGKGTSTNVTKDKDLITYLITVNNTGNVDLTNVTLSDPLISLSSPIESKNPGRILEVGEKWTYTGNYNVTQEDINNNGNGKGLINNTATVDCYQLDAIQDSAEILIERRPAYTVDKVVTDVAGKGALANVTAAGDITSYKVNVSNSGNVDLTNVTVTDSLINLTAPLESLNINGILEVGETWNYNASYNVTQVDINNNGNANGLIENIVTVDSDQLEPITDKANVSILRTPDYNINKTVTDVAGNGPAAVVTKTGETISYFVALNNTGNVELTNVSVTDPLISLAGPLESKTPDRILEVGETWNYTGNYTVTQTNLNNNGTGNGLIINTATADCDQLGPRFDTAEVPLTRLPDYTLDKTVTDVAGKGPTGNATKAGGIISYSVLVNNTGNVELTNVTLTDSLIKLMGPVESGNNNGILEVGENWTYTGKYAVTQVDLNNNFGGSKLIKNTAVVDCDQLEPESDLAEVHLEVLPTCTIDKMISDVAGRGADGLIKKAGDIISYQINVSNSGNIDLTNATVDDSLINLTAPNESLATNGILEVGENWIYTANYKVTQGDLNSNGNKNGSIENIAVVDSDQLEPQNDSAAVFIERKLAYDLNKTVTDVAENGPTGIATKTGEIITYQVKVGNLGNVDLTNITISDSLTNLSGPIESKNPDRILEVEENWTYNSNYAVLQADLNSNGNGNALVENTATVDCDQLEALVSTAEVPLKSSPAYTIGKTVTDVAGKGASANVTKAGERISYSITVNNTGNIDLTNTTIDDSLINLTEPLESLNKNRILEVGETWTCTGNYTVTQENINTNNDGKGFIENTATVDCDQLDEKSDNKTVLLKHLPDYLINKTVIDVAGRGPTANVTAAGEIINYQINVSNPGNVDLTNVTVTDSLINLVGPIESKKNDNILEVEEIWSFTGNYTVLQSDINTNGTEATEIINKATVDSDQLEPKSDTANVPIEKKADYTIDKTVIDVAGKGPLAKITKAGDIVSYSVIVNNAGNIDLTNVTVDDSLTNLTGPVESKHINDILEVGETWNYTGNYTVTQTDINNNGNGNGIIENKVVVDCDQLEPKTDSSQVPLDRVPDYAIDKKIIDVAGKGPIANVTKAGDLITYQINLNNNGNTDLTNVNVTDSLIRLNRPVESINADRVLEVGEIWAYTGTYTVIQTDINTNGNGDGLINNTATVDCDQLEPKSDSAQVQIDNKPAYSIDKKVLDISGKGPSANITKADDIISYSAVVYNEGNVDLTNVTVQDSLISLTGPFESKTTDGILEVGENWIYEGNYTVTQADINSNGQGQGLINNIVTVDSDQLEPKSDNESVPLTHNAQYTIDKTIIDVSGKGQNEAVVKAGDLVNYQININNTGNVDFTKLNVTDSLIELIGPIESHGANGILQAGETWTYIGTYSTTQGDINTNGGGDGFINNTATVKSDLLDPKSDSEAVPVLQNPDYKIDKTITDVAGKGPKGIVTASGEIISYFVVVSNIGNTDLTNVTSNDSLINLTEPTESKISNRILEVGETWTYTGNYTVTQADINTNGNGNDLIENTATIDCDQLEPKSDTVEAPLKGIPAYNIDKEVRDVAGKGASANVTAAGEIISYGVNVTNTGNLDLTNVTVIDSLINLTGPIESRNSNAILEAGEFWNYNGNYTVTQADINDNGNETGFIKNTATVDCDQLDPIKDNTNVSINLNPGYKIYKAVIDIARQGSKGNVTKAGEIITYQVNVTNSGNIDLTNVTIKDSLTSLKGPFESLNSNMILEVGENWTYDSNYTVTQADINNNGDSNGLIKNTVTIDCDQLDPISDSKNVSIAQSPEYTVDKIVTDISGHGPQGIVTKAGEIIGYSIVVKNIGNSDLTNVSAFDSLINLTGPIESKAVDRILEAGEIWNYSGNYIVTQNDINSNGNHNGSIENKVTIDCDQLEPKSDTASVLLKETPDYTIEKSVIDVAGKGPETNVTKAGEIISYQINVSNSGNIDLTNLSVNDSLIILKEPLESLNANKVLEVGENWIYEGNYTVKQADINNNGGGDGFINNTATVDCDQLDQKNDSADVQIIQNASDPIDKTVIDISGKGPEANVTTAGDIITYQINITNDGNIDLTNVSVIDSLINLTEPLESLNANKVFEVGETWTYIGNYNVTQNDMNNNGGGDGFINNTVTVSSDQLTPKYDSASVPISRILDYTVEKTAVNVAGKGPSGYVTKAGDIISYSVTVNNTGKVDLTNVSINDSLINLTGPIESLNADKILNPGENWNYTGEYTVTQDDINRNGGEDGFVNNTVTIDCDELEPKSDEIGVPIIQSLEYTINKIVIDVGGKGPTGNITKAGETIHYQVNVSNTGNTDLTNVNVNDSLINLTGPIESLNADRILEVGESWDYNGNYIVTQADINNNGQGNGLINNTATVDCDQLEPKSDTAGVILKGAAAYNISKTVVDVAGKGPTANVTKAGDVIKYQINVSNSGNTDLTNVTVTDSLINLTDPVESKTVNRILETEEVWTYNGSYIVTQEDINNNGNGDGLIENTATVDCAQLDPKSDNKAVPIAQNPEYTIDKAVLNVSGRGPSGDIRKAGDVVDYSVIINNIGNIDLTNVTVTDSLIDLTGPEESLNKNGILEVGETWNYTGNLTVTQKDINKMLEGYVGIYNMATVDCDQLDPKSDGVNVPVLTNPDYSIDKAVVDVAGKGSAANVTKAGEIISYSVTVNNTGNIDLTNVKLIDPLTELTGPVESKTNDSVLEVEENWIYTGNYTVTQADINRNENGEKLIENNASVDCDQLEPKSDEVQTPINAISDYIIDKTIVNVAGKGPAANVTAAGDIISYQITVTNTGDLDLTHVTVTDSLINLTGPIESKKNDRILETKEIWTYDGNYTVTQADINTNGDGTGFIRNTATVDCDQLDPASDSKNVSIIQGPEYTVDKTVTDVNGHGPQGIVTNAGEIIGYSIVVKNTGNNDLTNVTAFDSLINLTEPIESKTTDRILEVGEIWNYSGNYIVTQTDINNNGNHNGSIANTVTIDCDQLEPKSDTAAVLLKETPDYTIEKSVIDVSGKGPSANVTVAGDVIAYQVKVTNNGNMDLTNLTVNDSLIILKEPLESLNTNKVLEVGENWTYSGNYTVSKEDINTNGAGDGFINNMATVDCDQLDQKNDSATVPIKQNPALSIEKEVADVSGRGSFANVTKAGEIISYRINVTNNGNIDFTNATVTDSLINLNGPVESVSSDGILQAGENWVCTGNYTATQEDINTNGAGDGFIDNTATIDCDQMDPQTDTAKVALKGAAVYNINKTVIDVAGKGPFGNVTKAGDIIKYHINVSNSGNTDLTNVTVTDSLINLTDPIESKTLNKILEVEETWNYTGSYIVTQEDINNNGNGDGLIENTATVDCAQLDPKSDNKAVPIAQNPEYTIDKAVLNVSGRGPSGDIRKAGDVVDYSVIINNIGNIDLTNVTVTDSLIDLTGPEESLNKNGILEVGETWNYTGNLTVTQKDINKMLEGYVGIYNMATVDCDQLDPKSDGVNVPVLTNPDYSIDKAVVDVAGKGSAANVTKAGEIISYSVTVNNTGNIDLTNVKLIDPLTELTGPVESKTNDSVLEVEENWIYTGNYTVTQADINRNENGEKLIENNASVDCDQLEPKSDEVQTPMNAAPDYVIDKIVVDVAGKGPLANVTTAGDIIIYQINITNNGSINLTNVTTTDSLINLTGPIESKVANRILDSDEIWTYTGNYTATQADINNNGNGSGLIENVVTVDSDQLDPESDSANVSIAQNAGYAIEKTPTDVAGRGPTASVTKAGELINYQVSVNNTGNIDLTNATVADSLINLTGPIESETENKILEVGEIWNYTGNYTVKQADINTNGGGDGFIENTATVKSDQLKEESDTAKVPLNGTADFAIDKIVTDIAGKGPSAKVTKAGEKIAYQIIVTNSGNIDLTNVNVDDFLINLASPDESLTTNEILEVGETWTYEGNYTVTQVDINTNGAGNGLIENTATVDCDQLSPESDSENVSLSRELAYSIDKIVVDVGGKGPIGKATKAGEKISYFIIVTNEGNANLVNVTVIDSLTNLDEPTGSMNKNKILELGEFWIFESKYTVTQNDINTNGNENGFIENTATVDCDELEPKSKTAKVPVENGPAYTIDKKAINIVGEGLTGNATKAGDVIEYSVIVDNTGNVDLTNVTVSDSLIILEGPVESNNSDRILEVGESWNYSGNYRVTQLDINSNGNRSGFIKNTATVDSDQLDPKTDDADVPIAQSAAYTIDKIAVNIARKGSSANVTKAGSIIEYQINVSNTGNTELTNITVSDSLIALTGPIESKTLDRILETEEIWTYKGNYTVTQADINNNGNRNGFIENIATVDCDQLEPKTDNEAVPITQNLSYLIEKRVIQIDRKGNKVIDNAGEIIDYEIEVINEGNVNLTNVTVTDSLIILTAPRESKTADLILEIGENWIYRGAYTVNQADIDSNGEGDGLIENKATVRCDQLGPKSGEATVQIIQDPALNIDKSASPTNYSAVDQIITYTYNITNIGNMNVTAPISVTDNKTGTINVNEKSLIPRQSILVNTTYIITQADLDRGFVTNAAFATGNLRNNTTTSNTDNETVTAAQNASYEIKKIVTDADGKGLLGNVTKAGDTISYQINVTNNGNINLTNVNVTDILLGNLTGPDESINTDGVLEVGETWTYTGTYTVTQADIDSNGNEDGFIENTATVDCDQLEPKSDSAQVSIGKQQKEKPGYIIDKTVTDVAGKRPAGNVTTAGEIISYQINVRNIGSINLTNISVNDSLISLTGPTGDNEPIGILNIEEDWVYTGNYTVIQEDIDTNGGGNGFIDNTATVDCDQLESESDNASVPIDKKIKLPDYLIHKSIIGVDEAGDGIINAPGDIIEYQVIIKNTGEINLTNVSVGDSLITLTGPREFLNVDMILEIGETWIYTGTYTVTQADINSNGDGDGFIDNTATVSCNELPIKSSSARQPILYEPEYNIYKSIIGVDEAGDCIINKPGDIIEYIIVVKNEGNVDLTDVLIQDTLINVLVGPTGDDIDLGVLNPGETWKYTGIYTVTEEDINSNEDGDGFIENIATVSSKELPKKSSVAKQPIVQKTDLCMYKCISGADKAGDCVINKPGEIIEYEIVLKNSGRADLTGVIVNDPMLTLTGPTGDNIRPGVLNPGEIWKYIGNYTVTREDINSNGDEDGFIENTVTVHANEAPEEKSSARQAIVQKPDYCIYKFITNIDETGDHLINKPGDKIEYCIVVKNEGNCDLTGILVKDALINLIGPSGNDIDPGILNPEEAWKYTGSYTVTEQDIKTNGNGDGFIENTATVTCNELSSRNSSIQQAIILSPSSEIGKDSNPTITPGNEKDKNNDSDDGGSSGGNSNHGNGGKGSSGGGAGGSPEPAKNVETKEIAQAFVTNGEAVKFEFINNATCVVYVSFDAKKTAGKVTTIVEMLKGKSALVSELPAGEVYKSFNVWVGNDGFATAKNIDNAVICFRVEKAWIRENNINESTIILNRYNEKEWIQLPTNPSGEDDKFLYYVAETSKFGCFSITAEKNQIFDSNTKNNDLNSRVNREVPEEKDITGSINRETSNTSSDANKEEEKPVSGFELLCGVVGLSAASLYKRR